MISFEVESVCAARAEILDVFGVPVAERDLGFLDSGRQDVRRGINKIIRLSKEIY